MHEDWSDLLSQALECWGDQSVVCAWVVSHLDTFAYKHVVHGVHLL